MTDSIPLRPVDAAAQPLLHEHGPSDEFYEPALKRRRTFANVGFPRLSSRQLKILVPIVSLILVLVFAHRSVPQEDLDWTIQYGKEKLGLHACSGWTPDTPVENDPPGCLRARQWRELEHLLEKDDTLKYLSPDAYPHNLQAVARLKMCLLNEIKCPPRPVIISGWGYMTEAAFERPGTSGEVIWMRSVIQQFEELGYILLATRSYEAMVKLSQLAPSIYHQVWASDVNVASCVTDPRCIALEHYRPPQNATSVIDPADPIPEEEQGVIPLWRLHAADYWGSRPSTITNTNYYWGRPPLDPTEWSWNPLGQYWNVAPFAYPDHGYIPFSIEKICTKVPLVKTEDRENTGLIYAKKSSYFWDKSRHTPPEFWPPLAGNLTLSLLSTARIDPPLNCDVPKGIKDIGMQTRLEYEKLVGSIKVLIGIGKPTISPSVYTALCQGTPVVLPYFDEDPTPPGWLLFADKTSQHGPALALGEPYAYGYRMNDIDDLQAKIIKASQTPIGRYIPPDMRWNAAVNLAKRYISQDWETKFDQVVAEAGGEIPRLQANIRERCFELNRCVFIPPAPREGKKYDGLTGTWSDV